MIINPITVETVLKKIHNDVNLDSMLSENIIRKAHTVFSDFGTQYANGNNSVFPMKESLDKEGLHSCFKTCELSIQKIKQKISASIHEQQQAIINIQRDIIENGKGFLTEVEKESVLESTKMYVANIYPFYTDWEKGIVLRTQYHENLNKFVRKKMGLKNPDDVKAPWPLRDELEKAQEERNKITNLLRSIERDGGVYH